MAENVVLNNLANLQNDTTTINTINGNNATITAAFSDVLSRTGVSPNAMGAPLDMNNWPIMNLPAPGSANSPARLQDVTGSNPISISLSLQGDITAPASSGVLTTTINKTPTNNNILIANGSTWNSEPVSGAVTISNTGVTTLASSIVGSANIINNAVANADIRQSVATSVVGNSTNATANVADITASAARQVLAMNIGGTAIAFAQPQGDQLKGTTTNDNASAGNVGEYVSASVVQGAAVSLTTNVAANITSISLTAGDWDLWGNLYYTFGATTTLTSHSGYLTTTSASTSTSPLGGFYLLNVASSTPNTTLFGGQAIGPVRVSLTTTTTWFLVAQATFATSTCGGYGIIQARRIR